MTTSTSIDRFLAAIESASIPSADVFADDAVLDATVPHWRFSARGAREITATMAGWYADPAELEELRRTPLPDGELVEVTVTWEEAGVPHAARQVHVIAVDPDHGRIVHDTMWCGGRWPASLLAQMEGAGR